MKKQFLSLDIQFFGRKKNALREHWVQDYVPGTETPVEADWVELGRLISSITDSTSLETEEQAWYDGDGTPEASVVSISEKWDVAGQYDPSDEAQELIAGKKRKVGDERKVFHKIVSADKTKEWIGRATLSENIVAGSGDASAYQEFSCSIQFDVVPPEGVHTTP